MSKTNVIYKEIAPGAAENVVATSDAISSISDLTLIPEGYETEPAITLEHNQWMLNGKHTFVDKYVFWSKEMSKQDCTFTITPSIMLEFTKQFASPGITLSFDEMTENYCDMVTITWYQGDNVKSEKIFYPDSTYYYCENAVTAYDKILVEFNRTSLPYRYVRLNQVIFGIYRTFDMEEIRSAKITNESSGLSTEIPISKLNFRLDSRGDVNYMFLFKQPVEVHNNNVLIGVYYIDEHKRVSKSVYDIECYDAVGVLSETVFGGGVYSGYSARQLIMDIVGEDFDVVFEVNDTMLTGIITAGTKRDSIQQVLFAWGACLSTDGRDSLRIFETSKIAKNIDENHAYQGATVETSATVTEVQVTAHTYTEDSNGSVEVNGIKYRDTMTIFSVTNPDITATDKSNIVSIKEATLVSPDNVETVAQRVYDYYLRRQKANSKIVWQEERLGDMVTVPNAWGSPVTGNIEKMEITLSNTVAAVCEVRGE